MAKERAHHLADHVRNPRFQDRLPRISLPDTGERLYFRYETSRGSWSDIAQVIAGTAQFQVAWVPDANSAIVDEAQPVWEALRLSGLGCAGGSALFAPTVYRELEAWLSDPRHNVDRAKAIRAALAENSWARKIDRQPVSVWSAIAGYAMLLGQRRLLACRTASGKTMVGTDPTEKCHTMNVIGNNIGKRAQTLAKKGRKDVESTGALNVNDELLCLSAVTYSLFTGRESVILTADEDLVEIFYKLQWFFDTHYRAFHAARLVAAGSFGEPEQTLDETQGLFDGPLLLYRRQTSHLKEVLPSVYSPVAVNLLYLAPDLIIHRLRFSFEREMVAMLVMRSNTLGRCTDMFDEKNIHIDLGPLKSGLSGLYLGIGKDIGTRFDANGTASFISQLDYLHAVCCQERVAV
jgi:hypothetical protein